MAVGRVEYLQDPAILFVRHFEQGQAGTHRPHDHITAFRQLLCAHPGVVGGQQPPPRPFVEIREGQVVEGLLEQMVEPDPAVSAGIHPADIRIANPVSRQHARMLERFRGLVQMPLEHRADQDAGHGKK